MGCVAQRTELRFSKPMVAGSTPATPIGGACPEKGLYPSLMNNRLRSDTTGRGLQKTKNYPVESRENAIGCKLREGFTQDLKSQGVVVPTPICLEKEEKDGV